MPCGKCGCDSLFANDICALVDQGMSGLLQFLNYIFVAIALLKKICSAQL